MAASRCLRRTRGRAARLRLPVTEYFPAGKNEPTDARLLFAECAHVSSRTARPAGPSYSRTGRPPRTGSGTEPDACASTWRTCGTTSRSRSATSSSTCELPPSGERSFWTGSCRELGPSNLSCPLSGRGRAPRRSPRQEALALHLCGAAVAIPREGRAKHSRCVGRGAQRDIYGLSLRAKGSSAGNRNRRRGAHCSYPCNAGTAGSVLLELPLT